MVKIEVEIPQTEYAIFERVAKKLGVPCQTLIQQEIDAAIQTVSAWTQRSELLNE